jgi:hypothetical protein
VLQIGKAKDLSAALRIFSEIHAETRAGLHEKCLLLSSRNKNGMCRHISLKIINDKFHENWLSDSRVGQTHHLHSTASFRYGNTRKRPQEGRHAGRQSLLVTERLSRNCEMSTRKYFKAEPSASINTRKCAGYVTRFLAPSASSGARISPFLQTSELHYGATASPLRFTTIERMA